MHPPPRTGALLARLAVAGLLALAATPSARAIDQQSDLSLESQKSMADYFSDLEGDSDPDRLYAARVLRGELRRALKAEARSKPGSIAQMDASAVLVELEARLPGACRAGLQHLNTVAPCADILALLDVKAALPELEDVLKVEKRKWARRHLERAIATLAS